MRSGIVTFREQVVKGIVWVATRNWGKQALSFVFFVVLSRMLGPEAFGLVAMATIFVDFVELFLDLGLGDAIVQRVEVEAAHLNTAFWTALLIGAVMLIGGISLSTAISEFFREPRLAPVVRWLSLDFLIGSLSMIQLAILKRRLAFKSLALRSIGASVGGGIVGIGMAVFGFGVWSLVGQTLSTGVFAAIILWNVSDWRPRLEFHVKHFKELLKFGISIVGIDMIDFFNKRTDDLLIGYFLGATLLGYYTVAYKLLLVMLQLLTGITVSVAFPAFSRLQTNPERLRRAFYKATQYTSFLAFPAFLGILVIAPELTRIFFGSRWLPSAPVMQILALSGILQAVSLFNATMLKASGKPSWWLGISFLTAVVNVIGFRLVVNWGIQAVASVFVIVGYSLAPIAILAVRRSIGIDLKTYLAQFVAPLVASVGMAIFVFALKSAMNTGLDIVWRLVISVTGGALVYLLIIQLMAPAITQELIVLIGSTFPKLSMRKA